MNWLTKLFSTGAKELVGEVGDAVAAIGEGHTGKKELAAQLEALVVERFTAMSALVSAELGAKERALVAELTQGDTFTKRARPSVVYFGLIAVGLNNILLPWLGRLFGSDLPPIVLPTEFWYAWGGICGTWAIGRSVEKVKGQEVGDVTRWITGSKKQRTRLLED